MWLLDLNMIQVSQWRDAITSEGSFFEPAYSATTSYLENVRGCSLAATRTRLRTELGLPRLPSPHPHILRAHIPE
jgi:hypothetical protein